MARLQYPRVVDGHLGCSNRGSRGGWNTSGGAMVGGTSVGRWNWRKKKEYSKRLKSMNDVCSCTSVEMNDVFKKPTKQGLSKIQKCRVHALHSCFHDRMHLEGALADPRGMDTSIECLRWLWRICSECMASKQKLDNRKGSGFQVMSLVLSTVQNPKAKLDQSWSGHRMVDNFWMRGLPRPRYVVFFLYLCFSDVVGSISFGKLALWDWVPLPQLSQSKGHFPSEKLPFWCS